MASLFASVAAVCIESSGTASKAFLWRHFNRVWMAKRNAGETLLPLNAGDNSCRAFLISKYQEKRPYSRRAAAEVSEQPPGKGKASTATAAIPGILGLCPSARPPICIPIVAIQSTSSASSTGGTVDGRLSLEMGDGLPHIQQQHAGGFGPQPGGFVQQSAGFGQPQARFGQHQGVFSQ
jgi:hypothetical protein